MRATLIVLTAGAALLCACTKSAQTDMDKAGGNISAAANNTGAAIDKSADKAGRDIDKAAGSAERKADAASRTH